MTVLLATVGALLAALASIRRRLTVVAIEGPSMKPALNAGDRLLVSRGRIRALRVGQVVVAERPVLTAGAWQWSDAVQPRRRRRWMIKRIAAVPGAALPGYVTGVHGAVVPEGYLVLLGDNPDDSLDSRSFGLVPVDRLLGVAVRSVRYRYRHRPATLT